MSRGASTRRLQFLPYRFDSSGLALHPRTYVLDGKLEVAAAFDTERHLLDLSAYKFEHVELTCQIELHAETLAAVFPNSEQSKPVGRIVAVVRCGATRLRRGLVVTKGALQAGSYDCQVTLSRNDVVGSASITPYLLRNGDRRSVDEYASADGSRVAAGRTVEVRVETLRPPTGDYLDIRYESFKAKGAPQFPHVDALYRLECSGEAPILWLNADHERVCAVLDDAANVGRMARMRDVVFDQISQAVWLRLFLVAARDVAKVGEAVFEWQDAVLLRLLPLVYPDVADHESRIAALRAEVSEDGEQELLDRLEGGLQQWLEIGKHATALAEEIA